MQEFCINNINNTFLQNKEIKAFSCLSHFSFVTFHSVNSFVMFLLLYYYHTFLCISLLGQIEFHVSPFLIVLHLSAYEQGTVL